MTTVKIVVTGSPTPVTTIEIEDGATFADVKAKVEIPEGYTATRSGESLSDEDAVGDGDCIVASRAVKNG